MTLAIWSSNRVVPFVSHEDEIIQYRYHDNIVDSDGDYEIFNYQPGKHIEMLTDFFNNTNNEGIYFVKYGNKWSKYGTIAKAEKINDNSGKVIFKLFVYKNEKQILSTNKKDSLQLLGYHKKNGKGMGNIMHGVCFIENN